jgi:hypothetical protein
MGPDRCGRCHIVLRLTHLDSRAVFWGFYRLIYSDTARI